MDELEGLASVECCAPASLAGLVAKKLPCDRLSRTLRPLRSFLCVELLLAVGFFCVSSVAVFAKALRIPVPVFGGAITIAEVRRLADVACVFCSVHVPWRCEQGTIA